MCLVRKRKCEKKSMVQEEKLELGRIITQTTTTRYWITTRKHRLAWMQLLPANTPTAPAPITSPIGGCSIKTSSPPPPARIVDGGFPYDPPPRNESASCVRWRCTGPASNAAGSNTIGGKTRVAGMSQAFFDPGVRSSGSCAVLRASRLVLPCAYARRVKR